MPYYFTTLILLVVSVILAVISLALEGKRRVAFGVGMAIKILADGSEVYQSDTITSSSTGIPPFHVDADGVQQIVIQIEARVTGRPFVLGIAYD